MTAEQVIIIALFTIATPVVMCTFFIFLGLRPFKLGIVASVVSWIGLMLLSIPLGPLAWLLVCTLAGWTVYSFMLYRQSRREELYQVLCAATQANLPLPSALRAYLQERPPLQGGAGWAGLFFVLFPPGFSLWWQRLTFDHKIAQLVMLLDQGAPLSEALRTIPGIASTDMRIAASVGERTGRLAETLNRANRPRFGYAWLEAMPRLLYPLLILAFITGILAFLSIAIVPKFKRIYSDFGLSFPPLSQRMFDLLDQLVTFLPLIVIACLLGFLVFLGVALFAPSLVWFLWPISRMYRMDQQGLVLRSLGSLLRVGQTVPQSLSLLVDSQHLPAVVARRASRALQRVNTGEPLSDALERSALLPASMSPLLSSAEKIHYLPGILEELGVSLSERAVRNVRRWGMALGPLFVVAMGALVALICVAFFLPLVDLISRMSE